MGSGGKEIFKLFDFWVASIFCAWLRCRQGCPSLQDATTASLRILSWFSLIESLVFEIWLESEPNRSGKILHMISCLLLYLSFLDVCEESAWLSSKSDLSLQPDNWWCSLLCIKLIKISLCCVLGGYATVSPAVMQWLLDSSTSVLNVFVSVDSSPVSFSQEVSGCHFLWSSTQKTLRQNSPTVQIVPSRRCFFPKNLCGETARGHEKVNR